MHYVSGYEVGQHLTKEVHQLASCSTKTWQNVNSEFGETHVCHVGGMIAFKSSTIISCPPETLLHIILEKQPDWDINYRGIEVLEEYDSFNHIVLLTVQIPFLNKLACYCLYRCITLNHTKKEYIIVYQSVDHDQIPEGGMILSCAPSGYFVYPVEGDPNKCRLVNVFQFHPEEAENPAIMPKLVSASERITYGLRNAAGRITIADPTPCWDNVVFSIRRQVFNSIQDLNLTTGWSIRDTLSGVSVYGKQNPIHGDYVIALRGTFSMPYASDVVTNSIYAAMAEVSPCEHITPLSPPKSVLENAFTMPLCFNQPELEDGTATDNRYTLVLVCKNIIKENVCDVSYRAVLENMPGAVYIDSIIPSCGIVVGPTAGGCTAQWITQLSFPAQPDNATIRKASQRMISHIGYLQAHITKKLRATSVEARAFSSSPLPLENLQDLVLDDTEAPAPRRGKGKRKTSNSSLGMMNVDDIVLKNTKTSEGDKMASSKPFLFLVPNSSDGTVHHFVRRRRGSPLSLSNFDMLPQELLLEIFLFLDSSSLSNVSHTCSHFKEVVTSNQLWRRIFHRYWGDVRGRVSRRYAGDDDPSTFFTASFLDWKDLFLERQYIEKAWESPARRALSFSVTKAHTRGLRSMALLPRCHRLVTGSQDGVARVWDVMSGTCLVAVQGDSACISVAAERDTCVKLAYKNGIVRVFDVMTEECPSEVNLGEMMRGCVFGTNGIVTWHNNNAAMRWDETTRQCVTTFTGHTKRIKSCSLNQRESMLFTASRDTTVKIWDPHNGTQISSIDGHGGSVGDIAPLGEHGCITVASDTKVRVWDIRKLSAPLHVMHGHTDKVRCVRVSEIGGKICTGGGDGACIWRTSDFSLIRKELDGESVMSLTMDEESIAFGGDTGRLTYFDFTPHR